MRKLYVVLACALVACALALGACGQESADGIAKGQRPVSYDGGVAVTGVFVDGGYLDDDGMGHVALRYTVDLNSVETDEKSFFPKGLEPKLDYGDKTAERKSTMMATGTDSATVGTHFLVEPRSFQSGAQIVFTVFDRPIILDSSQFSIEDYIDIDGDLVQEDPIVTAFDENLSLEQARKELEQQALEAGEEQKTGVSVDCSKGYSKHQGSMKTEKWAVAMDDTDSFEVSIDDPNKQMTVRIANDRGNKVYEWVKSKGKGTKKVPITQKGVYTVEVSGLRVTENGKASVKKN